MATLAKSRHQTPATNTTIRQFAEATDLSMDAVRKMINRGEIRAVRLGRAIRIPMSEYKRLGLSLPATLTAASSTGEVA